MNVTTDNLASRRALVASLYCRPETGVLHELISAAKIDPATRERIHSCAERLVAAIRDQGNRGRGVEQFLREYGLSTPEGIVLLCLAESFLRVPDAMTADALIRDKLRAGDWSGHAGRSPSLLVNITTHALALSKKVFERAESGQAVVSRLMAAGGEPFVRRATAAAMKIMGSQFVMGRTIEEALETMRAEKSLFRYSFDMLGEGARTATDAARYQTAYLHAISLVGEAGETASDDVERPSISIKLSALHPRYEVAQSVRVLPKLQERLLELAVAARRCGVGLTVDAEETERLELSLDIVQRVASSAELSDYDGLGLAVQAYQTRAYPLISWIDALGGSLKRRIAVRLVKGAYWDTEIKRAQEKGLDSYPVFTRKSATDVSYLACARRMLDARWIFPAFATHNALTVSTVLEWVGSRRDFEFQRLFGMGEGLYEPLVEGEGIACRIYAPVGVHRDLLAYLVRRLLENGANTSFVSQVVDPAASIETLLADPVEALRQVHCAPHPRIPAPANLYGMERTNSRGIDLNDRRVLVELVDGLRLVWAQHHEAAPLVAGRRCEGHNKPIADPSDTNRIVGSVIEAQVSDVDRSVDTAHCAADLWSCQPVEDRAACLDRMADLLERDRIGFMALAVREAGKTIPDAVAEVREAIDFCRYYASRARRDFAVIDLPGPTGEINQLSLAGRGVFACVSPWNFPLAIFLGQISAALVAGNAVVAKPAPQTPLIAYRAVKLLHEAGVPTDVLHLLPGGVEIGRALIADPRVRGVAFTGSTASARAIARTLACKDGPIVPLIAETGGQNAMIVDSTALPEQVVGDILASGFQSAGQRCSALRLLFLQEDIAPRIIEMLTGAMSELVVGDPARIETDVGPVIDREAQERLRRHLHDGVGSSIYRTPISAACDLGWYVAPELLELDNPSRLQAEVFGPIVHVVRWRADKLDTVIDAINNSGYGLTLGIHSRISRTVEQIRRRARVGNLYVNRSMIGAVVGTQPFGGEGLSGTGPKAGGPRYLARFATERTVSTDTTSTGGNATLMSLEEKDEAPA